MELAGLIQAIVPMIGIVAMAGNVVSGGALALALFASGRGAVSLSNGLAYTAMISGGVGMFATFASYIATW